MFKKVLASCGIGLMIFPTASALAETPKAAAPEQMTESEASISNEIMGQLLNSIDKASLDFELDGATFKDEGFSFNSLRLAGVVKLNSDLSIDLGSQGNDTSSQLNKVMPKLQLDTKNIYAAATVDKSSEKTNMSLEFYKSFDTKKNEWVSRPLTLLVSNKLNKALLKIKFNWVRAVINASTTPGQPNTIKGTCSSEKVLVDIVSGGTRSVPVECEFSGTFLDDKYNINFNYKNAAAPAVGTQP